MSVRILVPLDGSKMAEAILPRDVSGDNGCGPLNGGRSWSADRRWLDVAHRREARRTTRRV